MLRLLLVALNCVLLVESKCYGRENANGTCARIKEDQFQIQGVQIVEASQKIHEDIEEGRYQPRSEIRRQATNANYQDETSYPQVGGGTVGQIGPTGGEEQTFSGVGVVPQQAPTLEEQTQDEGEQVQSAPSGGSNSFGGDNSGTFGGGSSGEAESGQYQQQTLLNQAGTGTQPLASGNAQPEQYRTGPSGKRGRGRGRKGKQGQPGFAPTDVGTGGGGGGEEVQTRVAPVGSIGFISNTRDPHNIHEGKQGAFSGALVGKYYYAPKQDLPLPKCFHNPTGYVCCNFKLNAVMESTYKLLRKNPKFNSCNVGVIATAIQKSAEEHFKTPFESIAALEDFAQKVHFSGDMVCKIEIDGKYILAYATPYNAERAIDPEVLAGHKKIDNEQGGPALGGGTGGGGGDQGYVKPQLNVPQLPVGFT